MVASRQYVPQEGDIVRITSNPQAGHDQAGRRPALVLSPATYNGKVGLRGRVQSIRVQTRPKETKVRATAACPMDLLALVLFLFNEIDFVRPKY